MHSALWTPMTLGLAILLIFAPLTQAKAESVAVAVGEWAPFISSKLPDQGTATQLFTAIMEEAGLEPTLSYSPWARAMDCVKQGTHPASFPWRITLERQDNFFFSAPIMISCKTFFYRTDRHPNLNIRTKKDAVGYTVAGVHEYVPHEWLQNLGVNVHFVSSDVQMFQMLNLDRVDLVYETPEVGRKLIADLFPETAHLYAETGVFDEAPLYAIFSRKHPRAAEYVKRFDQALERMKQAGRYERLMETLGLNSPQHQDASARNNQ